MMMAAASLPPTAALTPPSSSHGKISGRGDWEFSVPIHGIDPHEPTIPHRMPADDRPFKGHSSNGNDSPHRAKGALPGVGNPNVFIVSGHLNANSRHQQQPLTKHENYNPRGPGDSMDPQRAVASEHLTPKPALTRNSSTVSSNHDGDSVFDLYGAGTRMSTVSGIGSVYRQGLGGMYQEPFLTEPYMNGGGADDEDPEASKWIYKEKLEMLEGKAPRQKNMEDPDASKWIDSDKLARMESQDPSRWIDSDKLARIESQELHQADIHTASHSRTSSNSTYRRDEKKKRTSSPAPPENEHETMYNNPNEMSNDLRTPEEQALDNLPANSMSPRPGRKSVSSRIPLPTSSPTPIPQEFLERCTPLPRLLTSTGFDEERGSISLVRTRKRSHSAGSAFLLDEVDRSQTPPNSSPSTISSPKNSSRVPATPTSNRRSTASRTSSSHLAKQRTRSNPQLYSRPGTSASYAAHTSIASTQNFQGKHNAPEGPPPWSISSYKPDPSLPPDQQIIPTVAKRLQQEQWERDGVYASVYDRDLRPLKVHDDEDMEKRERQQGKDKEKNEWPLRNPTIPPETHETQQTQQTQQPQQPVNEDAGHNVVPDVNNTNNNDSIPQPQSASRQSDDIEKGREKKKKKKKFLCCTIM